MDDIFGPTFKPRGKNENGVNVEVDAIAFAKRVDAAPSHLKFTPQATVEETGADRFWKPDVIDGAVPSTPGFITDVIHHYRGREVSKFFMYWSALIAIAMAVKREAWMVQADERVFTNLYALIVGDSGSAKNTATSFLRNIFDYFEYAVMEATTDPYIPQMKMIDPVTSGATRAGFQQAMKPENKRGPRKVTILDANGNPIIKKNGQPAEYFQTSEIGIVQEEMSVFLNRQTFNDDLLPWLLSVYDPKDRDEVLSKGGGREEFRNILVSMLGNTTPVALKETLPAGVQSDGFLSRTILIYQSHTDHMFPRMRVPPQAASFDELKRRLGWIAATTFGEYEMSPEAEAWYCEWYEEKWIEVRASGIMSGIKGRHRVIVPKLAALIRWQRYERSDRLIHLEDIMDASKLLELTMAMSTPLYMVLLDSKSNDKTLKVEEAIRKVGVMTRAELVESTKVGTEDAFYAVRKLHSEGLIRCELWSNGRWNPQTPSGNTKERYLWKGKDRSKYADVIEAIAGKKAHQSHISMEVGNEVESVAPQRGRPKNGQKTHIPGTQTNT